MRKLAGMVVKMALRWIACEGSDDRGCIIDCSHCNILVDAKCPIEIACIIIDIIINDHIASQSLSLQL